VWVPATTRVVADAPQLRAYVDEYLDADIQTELEDQIVSGDGRYRPVLKRAVRLSITPEARLREWTTAVALASRESDVSRLIRLDPRPSS
jgi:hypothetical protein